MIATKEIPFVSQKDKERFWGHVDKTSSRVGCWLWTGDAFVSKYGRFCIQKVAFRAHRVSFILSGGEFSNGPLVLHRCRSKNCVNPSHLYSGTDKQNHADRDRDGTTARGDRNGVRLHPEVVRGESNGNAKITIGIVKTIRTLHSSGWMSYAQLGREFGLTTTHAMDICKRKAWAHVE